MPNLYFAACWHIESWHLYTSHGGLNRQVYHPQWRHLNGVLKYWVLNAIRLCIAFTLIHKKLSCLLPNAVFTVVIFTQVMVIWTVTTVYMYRQQECLATLLVGNHPIMHVFKNAALQPQIKSPPVKMYLTACVSKHRVSNAVGLLLHWNIKHPRERTHSF
jgi:hypothetical protein